MLARLSSYIDGELDASVCRRLESHLSDCPPCVAFIQTLKKTVGLFRSAGRPKPVPASARRLLRDQLEACAARLKKRPRRAPRRAFRVSTKSREA
ncbi:MAG: zf-HC2 domain-containing protein [Elusimicrobia bacterium]|nr:zf-HC2 domain-containing protein [Elusimicrobiota bacterium]